MYGLVPRALVIFTGHRGQCCACNLVSILVSLPFLSIFFSAYKSIALM